MQKEINKENFEILGYIINISRRFYNIEIDLYYRFGLMAQYSQNQNAIYSIIKNESYLILNKILKEIDKLNAYSYLQNRCFNEIRDIVKWDSKSGINFNPIYNETIIELIILMPEIPLNKNYIIELYNEVNEICENESYIDGQKEVCKYIKKAHKKVYRAIKILAYLDYLHFLKRVETKPEIIQTELDKKYINSRFETKKNLIKDVTYKYIGNRQTELDSIYRNIKNYLHSDTNNLADFKAIFSGNKLEEIKPLKINFTQPEIVYFVDRLMEFNYIKREKKWNQKRLTYVFKNHNGTDYNTTTNIKSNLHKELTENSKQKIDNIFK